MKYGVVAGAAILLAGLTGVPAADAAGLELLEAGYTAVRIGSEWPAAGEQVFPTGPQVDGLGNTYRVAGGAPGTVILKAASDRVTRFAKVQGQGRPVVLGLWFDRNQHMIVVVQRVVAQADPAAPPAGIQPDLTAWTAFGGERERVYYRIKGFPAPTASQTAQPAAEAEGASLVLRPPGRLGPTGSVGALLAVLCLAVTALVRQAQRDAIDLWHRR